MVATSKQTTQGYVVEAYGNLLRVHVDGHVRQGEVAYVSVDNTWLKAEIIEVVGDEVKIQVFEETQGISRGALVTFSGHLLEAELGPGLLQGIFDGLQNRLEILADTSLFLRRGEYVNAICRETVWAYTQKASVGSVLSRGDVLGTVKEGRFDHKIMVPFSCFEEVTITWVISSGNYTVDTVVAKGRTSTGEELEFTMVQKWPIKQAFLEGEKVPSHEIMDVGLRVLDTQIPVLKGGTFCTPGPFGAGKTVLQHHLSKYAAVDIVVLCACGERAGEVVEILQEFPHLKDPHTGQSLMHRTCIICNTSSMPVAARESSIYLGITIAEYYRQMGLHILLLADSTSRWAQALREISGRLEEIPGEEAFPAYLASRIAAFYERGGAVKMKDGSEGSLTICGAVSPAGGNFEEPVTQATLSVVGAFCGLSKARADARRYPSIDPMISWSKYLDSVAEILEKKVPGWGESVKQASRFLEEGAEIGKRIEVVGEEGISMEDMEIFLKSELYDFCYLQQNAFDAEDCYCPFDRQIELFSLMNHIFNSRFCFDCPDNARSFFLELQSKIKTLNGQKFLSEEYQKGLEVIYKLLESKMVQTA
ncbi:V-type ATP synthase alpha chain [Chlamydia trachomatis]|uniref:V-type ATP synthase alpha chain n=2 Tax=Chlamydia trachomatis TaxID=813 RepID=VATA_CHLT2|nr:V-type ATP synthase subunit A [Chlamydia trachomatis]B0B7M4.1 RecName: Full=V-type ATP synthase alpha chain; AltName: Full=V-ATPase subunit A [Chlamydia trachomatis 434/Bu]B0BBT9.1 RecName: Full=V-type ATP synthase alpha chain; AltName: Full=V-ATPase subunit A [Chlamydia trachomatis L2b/UCH-1/proctitis]AEJ77012.1 V-type ATP synthase alpha chain [Chlamydia trachomatis L2c]AGJ64663.1 ATP synthase subunit A [Chlamydia trachomatis L2/434/Bu(i)]AGJ65604.1 ATP synthase subunit A [Chlamydia tracho